MRKKKKNQRHSMFYGSEEEVRELAHLFPVLFVRHTNQNQLASIPLSQSKKYFFPPSCFFLLPLIVSKTTAPNSVVFFFFFKQKIQEARN